MTASRREFFAQTLAAGAGVALGGLRAPRPAAQPARRLIIDSHQHFEDRLDYVTRLVSMYRPRRAMACVLTPMAGFDVMRKAAADHPDIVIPYGQINVDAPEALTEIEKFGAAGDGVTIGPILLGANKPVHVMTPTTTVRRLVNMTALTVVEASVAR